MQTFSVLASVLTVVSFVLFAGIVAWAYGSGRKKAFEQAAMEPFALPDESGLREADPYLRPSPGGREELHEPHRDSHRTGVER